MVAFAEYLLTACNADERIMYGTGEITPREDVESYANTLLARKDVAFVDLRWNRNNCWQVPITR